MIRVLQLIEAQADLQTARGATDLAERAGAEFAVTTWTLGARDLRNIPSIVLRLRRLAPGGFDLVHTWGTRALTAAALGTRLPILYSPTDTRRRDIDWIRAVASFRQINIVCPTATQHRMHIERGLPIERVHLIRPGVDFARLRTRRNEELRRELGFSERDRVLLLAGEATRPAAHVDALWAGGILNVLDERYRVLAWGRGPLAGSVRWTARGMGQPGLLTVAEDRVGNVDYEALLAVADACLVSARGAVATLPIASAMAAGVPIVSTVTYTTAELLEDRHTALMVPPHRPRQFAKRVLDLMDDSSLRWSLADMARTEAFEYFSLSRFLTQYRTAYRQIAAGERVDIPEQAAGAGLRFHGRG